MKKKLWSIMIVFVLFVIGCSSKSSQQIKVYKIGVIAPLTGEGADYGTAMKQGIETAIGEINSQGGIKGILLKAEYEDDKLEAKEGVSAFNKLVSTSNTPVIIGSAASRVTLAIAPIAEEHKVVLISPISTADQLKDAGDYIFRNVPPNHIQGKTAAQFVTQYLKKSRVAILFKNDDYGSNLATSFREDIRRFGDKIVFDEPYGINQRDFRNILAKLKLAKPEAVFFPGNYQDNGIILKQAREIGIKVPFVGGDGAFSKDLISLAGSAAENSYFTMLAIPKSAGVNKFIENFKKKYATQEDPNVFVLYSYDALMIITKAIETGGYTSEGIKNALYSIQYDGVTGLTKFDKNGEVNKPYSIYKATGGKFVLLDWRPE